MKEKRNKKEENPLKYDVTFSHVGYASIEANSPEEAWEKGQALGHNDIEWADDFLPTDVQEM